ncbi:hypothetical protein D3C86_1358550 [compost metagenome]
MMSFSSGMRSVISPAFGPSAASRALRQRSSSASDLPSSIRTRPWKACTSVAYGISRLYWSNLPDANSARGGTSARCNSLTTEDLPMPE